ncbi:prolipoprotein diacylglyceryl transferase [Streptomyces angustmyceticus]|uniref:Phosphatidylglycerol--prolipoprotein diacylglyceryl transferase n=1 Tax=Streptomyces angustmyceticus TaxID=285578 RepID=A0A5J4LVM5_9ACTN|nr:prolipoprotein diacylglyceryl transferase [Streptomyces angustmyceticus]UAL69712.1 prolipoprotein diacylglyceryl transferase [Streptomyces angustmyceticus]GES34348.1 prolipoprotein diacylglyceryl transferase 1 [Streptomyces angustmyceticus]
MDLAFIPSPSVGVVHLGPIPLRGYAFCIIIGVFVGVWLGNKRWVQRGGRSGTVADIAVWAVPFGLVGGRLYHVITTYEPYFGPNGHPIDAFKVWEGGLGIWGAVALGAVGAWIGCRRRGIPLPAYADALAPGLAIGQAIGRWGNWFNQELYGKPTDVPWALKISSDPAIGRIGGTYHPTFLYECLWCLGVAALVIWADKRFRLGHGRAFALYVAAYCAGRAWIEYMRVDEAHHILGLRLNVWTALIVFVLAVGYFVVSAKKAPGREAVVEPGAQPAGDEDGESAEAAGSAGDAEAPGDEPASKAASGDDATEPDADGAAEAAKAAEPEKAAGTEKTAEAGAGGEKAADDADAPEGKAAKPAGSGSTKKS